MHWPRHIDYEDLLDGDTALLHSECGENVFLAVLSAFAGHTIRLDASTLWTMRRRYVRENPRSETVKEMSVRLGVSRQWIYDVLQDEAQADAFDSLQSNSPQDS